MKYIAFWEMKPEDVPKVIAKYKVRNKSGMENLFGAGLRTLFGPCHITGNYLCSCGKIEQQFSWLPLMPMPFDL
jgi:hypothetical protein